MKKYYVTEIFYSVQGEGKHTGASSIFVRLFGCNLKCQGFGMPAGELSNEREKAYELIQTKDITNLEELPLVKTGCDSYVAWDKRFRHLNMHLTYDELKQKIIECLPEANYGKFNNVHIVFTGGEPMMQQDLLHDLMFDFANDNNLLYATIETNGTYRIKNNFRDFVFLNDIVTFSISQKLACSGEPLEKRYKPDNLIDYFNGDAVLKFVVDTDADIEEAIRIANYINANTLYSTPIKVYFMPVGGCKEEYQQNSKHIAEKAMELGVYYSPRLHIDLFGNEWAT